MVDQEIAAALGKKGGDHTRTLEYLWDHLRETGQNPESVWTALKEATSKLLKVALPHLRVSLGSRTTGIYISQMLSNCTPSEALQSVTVDGSSDV